MTELTSISFEKDEPVEEILDAFFCYTDYFFKHPNIFRFFAFILLFSRREMTVIKSLSNDFTACGRHPL